MSIRSNYTKDSYKALRPGTRSHHSGCEMPDCNNCIYKKTIETQMQNQLEKPIKHVPIVIDKPIDEKPFDKIPEQYVVQTMQVNVPEPQPSKDNKPKNFLERFGNYVAENQRKMKAAGETSLWDDISKYGKNISDGTAALGKEEIDGISRKQKVSSEKRREDDDDLINDLMGKKRKK